MKTFYDVESLECCQELADATVGIDRPRNFKFCRGGEQCTEYYSMGGPDL